MVKHAVVSTNTLCLFPIRTIFFLFASFGSQAVSALHVMGPTFILCSPFFVFHFFVCFHLHCVYVEKCDSLSTFLLCLNMCFFLFFFFDARLGEETAHLNAVWWMRKMEGAFLFLLPSCKPSSVVWGEREVLWVKHVFFFFFFLDLTEFRLQGDAFLL